MIFNWLMDKLLQKPYIDFVICDRCGRKEKLDKKKHRPVYHHNVPHEVYNTCVICQELFDLYGG